MKQTHCYECGELITLADDKNICEDKDVYCPEYWAELEEEAEDEEIFEEARDNLGFGCNDDGNYYGDDESRYGEPLTDEECRQLKEEFKRIKKERKIRKRKGE